MPRLLPALCSISSISARRFSFTPAPQGFVSHVGRLRSLLQGHLRHAYRAAHNAGVLHPAGALKKEDKLLLEVTASRAGWIRRQRRGHWGCSDCACVQGTWRRLIRVINLRCRDQGRRLESKKMFRTRAGYVLKFGPRTCGRALR
uniref:Uncharacterized protein n=1 Tax=Arundo donax TaxID=35708 RepID=A0A0A9AI39_ARUDO